MIKRLGNDDEQKLKCDQKQCSVDGQGVNESLSRFAAVVLSYSNNCWHVRSLRVVRMDLFGQGMKNTCAKLVHTHSWPNALKLAKNWIIRWTCVYILQGKWKRGSLSHDDLFSFD